MAVSRKIFLHTIIGWGKRSPLALILIVGLLQGLLYTFLIPPWWHYDEPTHFETTWLIANRPGQPLKQDETLRRQMVVSMIKYDYYKIMNAQPDLSARRPRWIGFSNPATNTPAYYILAALPLPLLKNADVAVQNRAVRLMSLAMFLLTVWVTWKALGELLPEGHPLQWMVTLFVALLPGLTDTMTSVNDDVGAVLAFSLFLWASLRLLKRGLSLFGLAALFVTLALCYWTKETAWPAIPLGLFVVLAAVLRKGWLPWILTLACALPGLLLVVRWGDAAYWARYTSQTEPSRVRSDVAPLGAYAFRLSTSSIGQWFDTAQIRSVRNKTITLGAWMWADRPTRARIPNLVLETKEGTVVTPNESVSLTSDPVFVSATAFIPNDTARMLLVLHPALTQDATLYYDGVTLLVGGETEGAPHFTDSLAKHGFWGDHPFTNLARNASAETAWFWINPAISQRLSDKFSLAIFIASLQDRQGTAWYYRDALQTLFRTFWSNLARDKAGLPGAPFSSNVLEVVTALSLPGILMLLWRTRRLVLWSMLFFLGMAVFSLWALALARGAGTLGLPIHNLTYPWARYAFPAIIPTALLLCAGWWEGLRRLGRILKLSPWQQGALFVAFMLVLDLFALLGVAMYFYWKEGQQYAFLLLLTAFLLYTTLASIAPRLTNGEPMD